MAELVRKIALLGMGTVGSGVYHIIEKQKEEMPFKVGAELEIVKVLVRNKAKYAEVVPAEKLTDSFEDIINDDSIDMVVEVMGGIEPARTYIKAALEKGKHVVTANKDLMAVHGHELLDVAGQHHCDLLFEAAVAGGIPIIRPLKQCLAGNEITEVMGIINGTTNFILTKMKEDGMDFGEALQLATDLGYAEADPTADVEGYDAGRKLAIMAS
ncbi:MAG: homoserine dehydrogenase, partial [Anaerotignum sp.]|nr:homoserine dehydrogenase [Anaerotignum sp.]